MAEYPTLYVAGLEIGMAALSLITALVVALAIIELATRAHQSGGARRVLWLAVSTAPVAAALWAIALAGVLAARPGLVPQTAFPGWLAAGFALAAAALLLTLPTLARTTPAMVGGAATGLVLAGAHFSVVTAAERGRWVALDPLATIVSALLAIVACAALVMLGIRFREELGQSGAWLKRLSVVGVAVALAALPQLALEAIIARGGVPAGAARTGPSLWFGFADALWIAGLALVALLLLITLAAAHRRARRRLAETEALRRSEDRFRSLTEASAQIVWTTAPDGQMVDPQPSWGEFTGQDAEEYSSWGWFGAIHPEDRESTAAKWEEAIADRKPVELEHRVQRHDRRYRDFVVRMVPVLERDGRVREWVGTHTDVTDRARTQVDRDLLVEAGRVLSSSLDPGETLSALAALIVPRLADSCVVVAVGEDGGVRRVLSVHAEPARAELLREITTRYPSPPDGARGVGYVLRTEQSELIREFAEPVLRELAPDAEHRELLKKLGLTSQISVPLTARGQVLGVLTIGLSRAGERYDLRDLALAEELARRAAIAIDNARLHEQLQSAVRGRDDVLGIVSHDLRNPLHTITMSADLLLEEHLTEEARRKHLNAVRKSARAMDRLIQDLLDVSRSEAGRLKVEVQPEDPAEVLLEACETMNPTAEGSSVRLVCEPGTGLPPVKADHRRLLQVLSNLIGNAVKFSPAAGIVRVGAAAADGLVEFTVADQGPGIELEHIPRIFEAHWQAEETAHLGAGLGLAICKGIVDAHGGRIWVESAVGRGSIFHFTIPTASVNPVAAGASATDRDQRISMGDDSR